MGSKERKREEARVRKKAWKLRITCERGRGDRGGVKRDGIAWGGGRERREKGERTQQGWLEQEGEVREGRNQGERKLGDKDYGCFSSCVIMD